jgi:hypothetical protein
MVAAIGYSDVDVVVEGALDEMRVFIDYDDGTSREYGGNTTFNAWLEVLKRDLQAAELVAEVYVLRHEHEMSELECSCVQYLTDHTPAYRLGQGAG